jgi:hypothetical protein
MKQAGLDGNFSPLLYSGELFAYFLPGWQKVRLMQSKVSLNK